MTNQQISIFVIEESEVIRLGICAALKQDPAFEILGTSGTNPETVEQIKHLQPDIVLLDGSNLPLIEQLRKQNPNIKLLILGPEEDAEIVRDALMAGADGFCTKAVRTDWLHGGIKMIIAGGKWASPQAVDALLNASRVVPAESRFIAKMKQSQNALSSREQEVLNLLVEGYSNTEIGSRLYLSPETIKTHVRHIMEKLCVRDRTHAAVEAVRRGLVTAC